MQCHFNTLAGCGQPHLSLAMPVKQTFTVKCLGDHLPAIIIDVLQVNAQDAPEGHDARRVDDSAVYGCACDMDAPPLPLLQVSLAQVCR